MLKVEPIKLLVWSFCSVVQSRLSFLTNDEEEQFVSLLGSPRPPFTGTVTFVNNFLDYLYLVSLENKSCEIWF